MDLRRFGSVLWRFKFLVAAGCVLAILLSTLTIAKLDFADGPRVALRTSPVYASHATLLVTQSGFPWGSALQQYSSPGRGESLAPVGDLPRLTSLTGLYVQLANSDAITALIARKAPSGGAISAAQNYSFSPSNYSSALPLITITGTGTTRANALATTQAGVDALSTYLKKEQRAAGISDEQRVVLRELQRPLAATLTNPTKKTLPIVVFLTIMLAVTGLAFMLENLRPRVPEAVALRPDADRLIDDTRRSA